MPRYLTKEEVDLHTIDPLDRVKICLSCERSRCVNCFDTRSKIRGTPGKRCPRKKKKRPVIAISLKTAERRRFESLDEAEAAGFNKTCIWRVLRGQYRSHFDHVWRWATEND